MVAALARAPALVAVLRGPEHRYEFFNDAYRAAVDADGSLIGQPFGVSRVSDVPALKKVLDRVRETGEPYMNRERAVDARGPNGEPERRFYSVTFVALPDAEGKPDGVLLHSYDVTDLVRAREAVAEMQSKMLQVQKLESLGVLAGGIAHDFNNLLAAILGSVSAAAMMLPKESPAQAVLEMASDGARRAAQLTRQLLAYSGKGRFRVEPMDLSRNVRDLATLLETSVPKHAELVLDLSENLPAIRADVAQVQQVVMNLVLNAAEAIGEAGGKVRVRTGVRRVDGALAVASPAPLSPGDYVFVEVEDDGVGMDDATQAKMFDPFFTTKFAGRGLGLAAVVGIVNGHKGAIAVRSAPGQGTTFTVYFPALGESVRPTAAPDDEYVGSGVVMVVDDEPGVRRATRALLEAIGFEVIEAQSGRAAIEAFRARDAEIRAVIVDMTMPEMDGEATFRELRAIRGDVRVILSSGYDEAEATRRFAGGGLAGFLPKPFTAADLAGCMRAALGE